MIELHSEEKLFSFGDLLRLYQKSKKAILRAAFVFSALASVYALTKPVLFEAKATFKEGSESSDAGGLLGKLGALGGIAPQSPQAAALMQSHQVLKPLVCKMGLQIVSEEQAKAGGKKRCFFENLSLLFRKPLTAFDPFRFRDVIFEGQKPLAFEIIFSSPDSFTIFAKGCKKVGSLKRRIDLGDGVSFFLESAPKALQCQRIYRFTLLPWNAATGSIRDRLQITAHKINASIKNLSFLHRDRELAAEILNGVMQSYQCYLESEHDKIAQKQVDYLAKRQNDMYEMMKQTVEEHQSYLAQNLQRGGFMGLKEQAEFLSQPHARLYQSAFDAQLEMEQLLKRKSNGFAEQTLSVQEIQELRHAIQSLDAQRELIRSSLCFRTQESLRQSSDSNWEKDLALVQADLKAAQEAASALESQGELPLHLELAYDPNRIVCGWAEKIQESSDESGELVLYLKNLVKLFSVREKIVKERQLYDRNFSELEGIDLETAKQLLIDSSQRLDQARGTLQRYHYFHKKLQDPAFEISSLSTVFSDPVSQQLLNRATQLHLELKDSENYSEKEEERYRKEIELKRSILIQHISQMMAIEEMHLALCQEKIVALQQVSLDEIHRQICIKKEKIDELCEHRTKALATQKELLEEKMAELRVEMAETLPQKWRSEQLLEFKSEMATKMMQSIGELVESKTIGRNLHHIESKPLDLALTPSVPKSNRVSFFALAGAIVGAAGCFFMRFVRSVYIGFPAASDTLQALGYPFAGEISFVTDGPQVETIPDVDLETLRRAMFLFDENPQAKIFTLLGAKGPDYSYALAELLRGYKQNVLLLRADFRTPLIKDSRPGLLQWIEGSVDQLPIQKREGFDLVLSGGSSRFSSERIRSQRFSSLLEQLKKKYDCILLFSRASPDNAESRALLRLSDLAAVSFSEEPIELLTPFSKWAYHDGRLRLTFLSFRNTSS